jgi:hypothetical protein
MKTLIIGLAVGGALLASAGVASATPQEDAVVQQNAAAGYVYTDIPAMLVNANKVCKRFAVGQSRDQIVNDIVAVIGNPAQANTFVDVAVVNLCPPP